MIFIFITLIILLIAIPIFLYINKLDEILDLFKKLSLVIKKPINKISQRIDLSKRLKNLENEIQNLNSSNKINIENIKALEHEKNLLIINNKNLTNEKNELNKNILEANNEKQSLINSNQENTEKIEALNIQISELNKTIESYEEQKKNNYYNPNSNDFRERHPKNFRCEDGDYVRSKSENLIDNFFYQHKIWHIYEEEYMPPKNKRRKNYHYYPDFYLPEHNLYIEYFGMDTPDYIRDRNEKINIYESDSNIKFEYLTYEDDNRIYEKLKEICQKHNIKI